MTVAARTRLAGPSLAPPCDDQRSQALVIALAAVNAREPGPLPVATAAPAPETTGSLEPAQLREHRPCPADRAIAATRSEEHTSELQSRLHLVCRLLLEKKNE